MFAPLQISKSEIQILKNLVGQINLPSQRQEEKYFYDGILSQVTNNGVIDGSNLSQLTFPFDKPHYDVFISYSHNDESEALYLCGYLRKQGLKCFLDSTIWNSADALLDKIDKKYSWAEDYVHFDYKKRNFSTSHVHAMLSMAMLEAVRRSECCLFLRSNNSLTLEDGITSQTLSPWIYEEASFINNIQITLPERYNKPQLRLFCEGGQIEMRDIASNELKVRYEVDLKEFASVTCDDVLNKNGTQMLDDIYKKYGVIKNVAKRLID